MEENPYRNGKLDGTRKRFYDTGMLQEEAEYQKDVLNGKVNRYNPDGILEETIFFRKGSQVEEHPEVLEQKEKEEEEKKDMQNRLTEEQLNKLI